MSTSNDSLSASVKHGAAWAVGFFGIFFLLSSAFAAYSALQTVSTASTGATLSSSEWNKMVSNFDSVDAQLAALGALAIKSSVATSDIADSAVTDEKIASGISPSKLAQASATSNQVLKWNGSAWAPGADSGGAADFKAIMNATADHLYATFGLWGTARSPFTEHYTNTSGACGAYPAYPSYPSCPTGWTSMGTRQSQYTGDNCNCGEFGCSSMLHRTSQRYCKLSW